jgi:hypothetical protein
VREAERVFGARRTLFWPGAAPRDLGLLARLAVFELFEVRQLSHHLFACVTVVFGVLALW